MQQWYDRALEYLDSIAEKSEELQDLKRISEKVGMVGPAWLIALRSAAITNPVQIASRRAVAVH